MTNTKEMNSGKDKASQGKKNADISSNAFIQWV